MQGLIPILIVIAIINMLTSGNKKKKAQAKRKNDVSPAPAPKPDPAWSRRDAQSQIPYSREEWAAYLNSLEKKASSKKAKPVKKPRPIVELHGKPEGSISTQGESDEEHAEHRRRIAAEEEMRQQEHETLRELREANLERLRAAVVMSEVLGKPVSLRPRTGLHR